jgi:hypothetical protein
VPQRSEQTIGMDRLIERVVNGVVRNTCRLRRKLHVR